MPGNGRWDLIRRLKGQLKELCWMNPFPKKFTLEQAMKAQRRRKGIAILFPSPRR